MQPYLSLGIREIDPPIAELSQMIEKELDQIKSQGLLVPEITGGEESNPIPNLVWEKGLIDVDRVQKFWPTAPAHGQPGGSDGESSISAFMRKKSEANGSGLVYESTD